MLLRSGRKKPYEVCLHERQSAKTQSLLKTMKTTPRDSVFSLRQTLKCYILTEDSKTVHFDIDEDGHHEICTKDSQSLEDIAWLSVFTKNEPAVTAGSRKAASENFHKSITDSKNFVILTQRSKLNEFVLLCKGKKQLSLKVLKTSCSETDYPSVERCNMKTCKHEDPDFKQGAIMKGPDTFHNFIKANLTKHWKPKIPSLVLRTLLTFLLNQKGILLNEDNNFFIMHYQGDSVQFQCYEDKSYYLCVNDDSLDIRKRENEEPNKDKNFYFRVSYLQEK